MNKLVRVLILSFLMLLTVEAYSQGIKFEKPTNSFSDMLKKADKENKLMFVDMYTSWCAPCKLMEKNVFSHGDVGRYFNDNFVNYQIDGEKGFGVELAKKYGVKGYPTYFFINGKGELIYTFLGYNDVDEFIRSAKAASVFAKYGGWEVMKKRYETETDNSDFLLDYYNHIDKRSKPFALNKYLKSLEYDNLLSLENTELLDNITEYDYELFKKSAYGLTKINTNDPEFSMRVEFNILYKISSYLDKAIEKADEKRYAEILELKDIMRSLRGANDEDINLLYGRGLFFGSKELINLSYYDKHDMDDEFMSRFERYINNLIKRNPIDTVVKNSYYEMKVKYIKENPAFIGVFSSSLGETHQMISDILINLIDKYWRLSPSSRSVRKQCANWLEYIHSINPYNEKSAIGVANLLKRLRYKKRAISLIRESIENQKIIRNKDSKEERKLRITLRDIINNK